MGMSPERRRPGLQAPRSGGRRLSDVAADHADWIPVRVVADRFGVSDRTVRKWITSGLLRASNHGVRRTVVRYGDLMAFERRQQVHPKIT